jgi:hypothetical protein
MFSSKYFDVTNIKYVDNGGIVINEETPVSKLSSS